MANSTTQQDPDALQPSLPSDSETEECLQQGDLVVQGFQALINKCPPVDRQSWVLMWSVQHERSAEETRLFKKDLILQLHSRIVPQFHQQLEHLSESLDPDQLRRQPVSQLKLILEIQSQLCKSLNEIHSVFHITCPESSQSPPITRSGNDQHDNELKCYRLYRLHFFLQPSLLSELNNAFDLCSELILELKLSTQKPKYKMGIDHTRARAFEDTENSTVSLELAMEWLQRSDFQLVLDRWPGEERMVEDILKSLTSLIHQEPYVQVDGELYKPKELTQQVLKLVKPLVPIAKLSRLFLIRLSREMRRNGRPIYSELSSSQLMIFDELDQNISATLDQFLRMVEDGDGSRTGLTKQVFIQTAQQLQSHLESSCLLLFVYFIPCSPPDDPHLVPINHHHHHFHSWLINFNKSFDVAINNLLDAVGLSN
ncbi:hypothetical protein PGTUg99_020114 [Puccinia graminis f. sp. tritici]|uniref:Uncharacterized protein n=1 Tax=Puccinia graminis f. sp. tritici TaxID=56615 RepID=A0A5B0Q424_PUCGR|nr:hypothetical protein PGTUg99_020114 [Puccinia graminis f. sp. tritici]